MQPGDCSFLFCTFSSDRFVVVFLPELAIIRKKRSICVVCVHFFTASGSYNDDWCNNSKNNILNILK